MVDILFITMTVVFIGVCVAYVRWCDRIIGPDDFAAAQPDGDGTDAAAEREPQPEQVAA